ncbi:MAG: hypothetical protein MK108_16605 [Mariniblastus sp.]|nr:hypothetical protein [Mariniblastus sp.]
MNLHRLARDGVVLLAFGLAFYLVTLLIQYLGSGEAESMAQEVSFDRRQAEQLYNEKNWVQSAVHFERLVQDDPFNGHAWFFLGYSYNRQQIPFYTLVNRELRRTTPDPQKITQWNDQLKVAMQRAVPPLIRATDFPRYRNQARFMLARMHAYHGDRDMALQYLSEALQDGFISNYKGGLANGGIFEFRQIRDTEEFRQMVNWEKENHLLRRRSR